MDSLFQLQNDNTDILFASVIPNNSHLTITNMLIGCRIKKILIENISSSNNSETISSSNNSNYSETNNGLSYFRSEWLELI